MEKILFYLHGFIAVVITFGLAVFVHEFGHMMFALLRGVGVESFAIGMGPKIASWKWKGIDFSLRWFPVGGFVKLQGRKPAEEGAEENAAAKSGDDAKDEKSLADSSYDDLYALQDKGFLTKVLVFGGGVFMNYVTASVTIALVLMIGFTVSLYRLKLDKIETGSPLAKAGMLKGDEIIKINGKPVTYSRDLADELDKAYETASDAVKKEKNAPEPTIDLSLVVSRNGKDVPVTLAKMDRTALENFLKSLDNAIWRPARVEGVQPNSAADKAGLHRGDMITAINDRPVNSFSDMAELIGPNVNQLTELKVRRGEETMTFNLTPQPGIAALDEVTTRGYLGVQVASGETRKDRIANPLTALVQSQRQAVYQIGKIVKTNVKFFRTASMSEVRENVTGPIGIAAITAKMAQNGLEEAVNWFILLNLLLMIFNLLPLPVLDGGFILLAVIEGVIRRPVPPRVLAPIYTAFVFGLIILMVLISVQDLFKWVPRLLH